MYSQRDPQWANQRLGTRDGWTIGMYGCYVASQAMVASHFSKGMNPSDLDNSFTDRGLYYNENGIRGGSQAGLCWDGMLSSVFPDIQYAGTYHCESISCNLDELNWSNQYEHEAIIEVDFDHDPSDGIQTHFVRFNSYDANTGRLEIDDPWYGDRVNFADRYGDPAITIQKIVRYTGPSLPAQSSLPQAPAAEATPEPTTTEAPVSTPAETPVVNETPAPEQTPPPVEETTTPSTPPVEVDDSITKVQIPTIIKPEEQMNSITSRLQSRKLWIAVISIAYFMLHNDSNQALSIALAYLGIQGAIDHRTN